MTELQDSLEEQELLGQGQSEQSQDDEHQSDQDVVTAETEEGKGGPSSPETVEVFGRKYDLSKSDQVRELAKDYDRLGREFTPLTQRIAESEELLRTFQEKPQADFSDPETVEYLRQLGFVHREEQSQKEEDITLENTLKSLEGTYDGKNGQPKFDRRTVLEFCINNGVSNPEYGYKLMNYDALKEFDLRQAKLAPASPPSSGGEGGPRQPQPKKRVFSPPVDGQVSLRDAMIETLEQSTPTTIA